MIVSHKCDPRYGCERCGPQPRERAVQRRSGRAGLPIVRDQR